jgi:Domain of Unknown Function (DUF930)
MLCSIAILSNHSSEPACFLSLLHRLMHRAEHRIRQGRRSIARFLAVSLLLHLAVLPFLLLWSMPSRLPVAREESIDVQIVTLPRAAPVTSTPPLSDVPSKAGDAASQDPPERQAAAPDELPATDGEPEMVKPRQMLSEGALDDRRSGKVRKVLSQLAPAEQVEQLCNLEAMAQVGAWNRSLQPDRVVAYAMAGTRFDGVSFQAEGAALHSRQQWYSLQFKCDLAPDGQKVVAFEFRVGDTIPRDAWQDYSLPDESGPSD